jgi:excisionase family DNA binding protein
MAELMTLEEVAEYLRITKTTVYRLLKQGKIPAKKVGRQWRFDKTSIDGWLHQSTVKTVANILVVDDEETIRALFEETLEELGHKVVALGSSSEALELAKQTDFDLVFVDLKMPGMDGAEFIRQLKLIRPKAIVTIITGYPGSDIMERALAQGPFGVMNKPFSDSDIITTVNNFLQLSKTRKPARGR